MHKKVLIIGTNDVATACALKLFRSAFAVTMICRENPADLHYFRNYSTVLLSGSKMIANVKAQSYADFIYNQAAQDIKSLDAFVSFSRANRQIAVLNPRDLQKLRLDFDYCVLCDTPLFDSLNLNIAEMTAISCVASVDNSCRYNIIQDGPAAGQVNYPFLNYKSASPQNEDDLIYASEEAVFVAEKSAAEKVVKGEKIAKLGKHIVKAECAGYIGGILASGRIVSKGQPVASISATPIADIKMLPLIAVAVAGAALEAILYDMHINAAD
jgi:hypothetical protein